MEQLERLVNASNAPKMPPLGRLVMEMEALKEHVRIPVIDVYPMALVNAQTPLAQVLIMDCLRDLVLRGNVVVAQEFVSQQQAALQPADKACGTLCAKITTISQSIYLSIV